MVDTVEVINRLSRSFGAEAAKELAGVLAAYYDDLRQKILREEIGEVRAGFRELANLQERTEQRVGRLEQVVLELAEAQKQAEQRIGRLEQAVIELAEAQKRTEQRVEELAEAQKRTEAALMRLIERVDEHEVRLAKLDGRTLESSFREKASAYLGTVLRRTRVVPVGDLGDDLDGVLTPDEWAELTRADVILRGRAQLGGQRCDVYAVVEVSVTVEKEDVVRAARRAGLLRKKGWKVLAVAAGEEVAEGVLATAADQKVAVLQDGRQHNWAEALAAL